jgi:hypothetical protein
VMERCGRRPCVYEGGGEEKFRAVSCAEDLFLRRSHNISVLEKSLQQKVIQYQYKNYK